MMTKVNLASSRRGISEIISALLVICITVSAATLLGAYASGLMGRLQKQVSQPYTEQLTLDYYSWTCSTSCDNPGPTLIIRNDGAAQITLGDFYVQGVSIATSSITHTNCPSPGPSSNWYTLPVQNTCQLTLLIPSTLTATSGVAYIVKFVATDGTIFTFSCIAGTWT